MTTVVIGIEITVYVDVVFIINFIFDFCAIYLTSFVADEQRKKIRYVIAACMYATVDVLYYVLNVSNTFVFITLYLFVELLGMWISFSRVKKKKYMLLIVLHIMINFLMGGMITAIFNRVEQYKNDGKTVIEIFVISIIVIIFIKAILPYIIKGIYYRERIYKVKIKLKGYEITVNGLLDTGNALVEPTTKKQVTIVEKTMMKQFFNVHIDKIYMIPYKSLGMDNGVLYGIEVEEIVIIHDKFRKTINNAIIGIYNGKLSTDSRYNAILHSECLM